MHTNIGDHTTETEVTFDKVLSSGYNGYLYIDETWVQPEQVNGRNYYVLPAGNYYLKADANIDKTILIKEGEVNICLNGRELCLNQGGGVLVWEVIQINGGTLNLTDCQGGGKVCHLDYTYGRGVTLKGTGDAIMKFNMYGGNICENTHKLSTNSEAYGGGVAVESQNGTFNMYGGSISNNEASMSGKSNAHSGGVYNAGKFYLYDGAIESNKAYVASGGGRCFGGGVSNSGTFIMSGGRISKNRVSGQSNKEMYGGGVYNRERSQFTMSGGEISENTVTSYAASAYGGGVYNGGIFTLSDGGKISKNAVSGQSSEEMCGGGVYNVKFHAKMVMSGGEISENKVTSRSAPARGGGVYNNSEFQLTGGTIYGNTIKGFNNRSNLYGGGVCNDAGGRFTMSGGMISGHAATAGGVAYGGGVYNKDSNFTMNGGTITDNSVSSDGGGIYFAGDGRSWTISGGTITGNRATGDGAGVCICADRESDQMCLQLSGDPVIWENTKDGQQSNLYMYQKYDLKNAMTQGAKVGLSLKHVSSDDVMVQVDSSITDDMSGYFASDDSTYMLETSGSTIIRKKVPHTHKWSYSSSKDRSTVSVTCTGTIGTCDYQTTPATLTISTAKRVYDYDENMEAPTATLTYSNNWPSDLPKIGAAAIQYWKSTDGVSYNILVKTTNELKAPGQYMATVSYGVAIEACFSVEENTKQDPTYTAPTAKNGLSYNGQPQELINPGHATGGEMQYKVSELGRYSTSIPKAVDAGVYTVFYRVVGKDGYNDVAEQKVSARIDKAVLQGTPTFTPVTGAGKTLGDVALTKPADWPAGTFQWMDGDAVLADDTPITKGTSYYWKFTPDAAYNYYSLGQSTVLWASAGGGSGGGGGYTPPSAGDSSDKTDDDRSPTSGTGEKLTVPISGEQNTIQAKVTVTGKTATIEDVHLSTLDSVIGDHVKTGVVTIDFSTLDTEIETVKISADVLQKIARAVNEPGNDAESLHVVFPGGLSIEFDRAALTGEAAQVKGRDVAISIKLAHDSSLNSSQRKTVGSRTAYHISVTSGGVNISDLGGNITLHAPYELLPGEKAGGVTVYYVDNNGNKDACETSYDSEKKRVNWKTSHLSVYMIGYEEKTNPDTGGVPNAYVTYTVQKGDTLWAISGKYGCTVAAIVALNSELIDDPDLIFAGWELKIPQG